MNHTKRPVLKRLACLAALLVCAGCAPLYLPPVPEGRSSTPAPRLELAEGSGLGRTSLGALELRLRFRTVPEAGWLAPDATANETEAALPLPGEAEPEPGLWRAVLSFEGRLVRQFTLEVP